MLPPNIKEEDFIYNPLKNDDILKSYNDLQNLLKDFARTVNHTGKLEINLPAICRICIRVDQRKDYFMYYHSEPNKIMKMSHEKELALWSYWVCKYKPIRFKNCKDEEWFYRDNGCTVSDAFASYIIISVVCAKNRKKGKYFSTSVVKNLYYDLANRDFSKEALISKVNDLIS